MIYQDADVARAVAEDPQSAPIPDLHKAIFRFAELFVKRSWQATPEDLDAMRTLGASDRDLADWLQIACIQTWFTNSADAGGIPMDRDAVAGPVMSRERSFYHAQPAAVDVPKTQTDKAAALGWLQTPCAGVQYETSVSWALSHYGFIPNLFKSLSACPDFYPRHQLGLELLEKPVAESVSTSLHALVRATVIALNYSSYFVPTAQALLQGLTEGVDLDTLRADPAQSTWNHQSK